MRRHESRESDAGAHSTSELLERGASHERRSSGANRSWIRAAISSSSSSSLRPLDDDAIAGLPDVRQDRVIARWSY